MKLASLDLGRDGALSIVSRDLTRIASAASVAPTLQLALESWAECAPSLERLSVMLDEGLIADTGEFDVSVLASPLPRAHQFLDGSAYLNHVELVRKARGAELPDSLRDDPLMYQAVSDGFLAPGGDILVASEDYGIDFEAEVAVVVDDVPMGVRADDAGGHIKLVMLVNDVALRRLIPAELAKGFGFVVGKPRSSFAPVAVTPDELARPGTGVSLICR